MTIDPILLRKALGQFATGVVVVTSRCPDGNPVGLTINSFSSVSLEPPLVLFSLARSSFNHGNFLKASSYGINILTQAQRDISNRFARAHTDKWEGVSICQGVHDTPLIEDALVHMVCVPYSQCDGGDHSVFLARVETLHIREGDVPPLLFFRGRYHSLQESDRLMQAAWFDTLI